MNKKFRIAFLSFFSLFLLFPTLSWCSDKILVVDVRHRPMEMVVEGKNYSGPLLDIIKEAAEGIGYKVYFYERHFSISMNLLKTGRIDILPRTFWTKEREEVIDYIGPIGYQKKPILFLVKVGNEKMIQKFEDLEKVIVGVKKGAFYFDEFHKNQNIKKMESIDDTNMVKMLFLGNRFDTMIINDKKSVEKALENEGIKEFAYTDYQYPRIIDNYYGITQNHPAKDKLQKALENMVKSGRIGEIYEKFGETPPLQHMETP